MDSKGVLKKFGYTPEKCKLLNAGSFGRVYRYCDENGKDRAVKIIKYDDDMTSNENMFAINKEFELGKMMSSAKVGPELFEIKFDNINNMASIEMERMDMDLLTFFERFGMHLSPDVVKLLSDDLSAKLGMMAHLGVKCLDLKPENVMVNVDENGKIVKLRIIDFDPRFCSDLKTLDQSPAAEIAMKLMLAAMTHRVHPEKVLLFESDLSNIDDSTIDDMLSSDDDVSFFEMAWHYLIKDEKAKRKACVKNVLRDLVNEAKGIGAKRRRGGI